jgi:hypothetical protein
MEIEYNNNLYYIPILCNFEPLIEASALFKWR